MQMRQLRKIASLLMLLELLAGFSVGQIGNERKLSRVPKHLRGRLVERINKYFQHRQAGEYDKVYALISTGSMTGAMKPDPESFVRWQKQRDRGRVITKWKLDYVSKDSDDKNSQVFLLGFKVVFERILDEWDFQIEARIEGADWYFREYMIEGK